MKQAKHKPQVADSHQHGFPENTVYRCCSFLEYWQLQKNDGLVVCWLTTQISMRIANANFYMTQKTNLNEPFFIQVDPAQPQHMNLLLFWESWTRPLVSIRYSFKGVHSWSTKPSETHFTDGISHRRTRAFLYHKTRSRLSRNHLPRSPESLLKIFAAAPAFALNNKFDATIYNTILILALWMVLGKNHAICNWKTNNVESGNLENFQSQDCWARSAKDKLGGQVSAWHFWSWHPSIHNFMVGGDS